MKNLNGLDRGIRFILSIALIVAGTGFLSGMSVVIAYALAAVLLMTVLTGFCPLYKLLGISTAKKEQGDSK